MNKRILMLLALVILGPLLALHALLAQETYLACPPGQDLAAWCQKSMETKEKELQTELFTMVDIHSESEWNEAKQDLYTDYESVCATSTARELAHKPLPQELITPLMNVLNNQKIRSLVGITRIEQDAENMFIKAHRANGQTITFACGNKKIKADAATDQYTTLICPEELLSTHANQLEIESTIAHELMHIVHEDDLNVYCLNQIYAEKEKSCAIPKKKFARIKGEWERLQEERADLLAGAITIEYAQASAEQFKRNIPARERLKPTDTHPTQRERAKYMGTLIDVMAHQPTPKQSIPFTLVLLALFGIVFCTVIVEKKANKWLKY